MKIRLLVLLAIVFLLPAMATATIGQASTLEFIEQALWVKTWDALAWLGEEYGVFTLSCECHGEMYGNLSVGGFLATENATVVVDETLGNACTLTFEPSAYDAVKAELVKRYGEPQTTSDADSTLAWAFRDAEIRLMYPDDGELALIYTSLPSPVPSQPTFQPPPTAPTATPAPTREPQAAALSQEKTFAFMERASMADAWEALLALMQQYGFYGHATGCYADITGDLSIAGANADVVMILCGDHEETTVFETTGFDYDIWFNPEAYDAVKEALVKRYGEPKTIEEPDHRLVWSFQQTEVCLLRSSHGRVVLYYSLQPITDDSKPTFPPPQAVRATPAPTQAKVNSFSGEGSFIAFMEQAALAYSRKALEKIGLQYGLDVTENKRGARLTGSIAVGEYTALHMDACSPKGLPGFDCYAYFEPDAFDILKAALAKRYGEPVALWGFQDGFIWPFAEVDVYLKRSVAGMVEVHYAMQSFSNDFYPTFPPLLAIEAAPAQVSQITTSPGAGALAFMEQVLRVNSLEALEDLGKQYGLTAKKESDWKYTISGNLSIDGFSATESVAYDFDSTGFTCSIQFASDAYDAVLDALVHRYGDPKVTWGHTSYLVWDFERESVQLYRSSFNGGVTLSYSPSESSDES
ncbi:MAG: hypothetical protein FWD25_05815 [Clostridia bacterium]|nr:hypothetical protein [Clostridia bacterium]